MGYTFEMQEKRKIPYYCFFVLIFLLAGCFSPVTTENEFQNQGSENDPLLLRTFDEYDERLQKVLLNSTDFFRGITPGMSKADVRGMEKAQFEELELDSLGKEILRYSLNFNLRENADIEYFFGLGDSLSLIQTVMYFSAQETRDSVQNDFIEYFDNQYDIVSEDHKIRQWQIDSVLNLVIYSEGDLQHPNLVLKIGAENELIASQMY